MSVRRNTRRALSVQSLENRNLCAGDINLQFINGDLFLSGDGDAEQVEIQEIKLLNQEIILVKGLNGTTINGQVGINLNGNAVRNVNIDLNGGNDILKITALDGDVAGGNLSIDLGGDDDSLTMNNVRFTGDVSIDGDSGRDVLNLTDVSGKNFLLDAGNGDDDVRLNNVDATDNFFANMNDGDDFLFLDRCNAAVFDLDGGDDDDVLQVKTGITSLFNLDPIRALASASDFETVIRTL